MLDSEDHDLLSYYMHQPDQSATATQVMDELGYPSVGAINLHVVRLAKKLANFFCYEPDTRANGQLRWWPCLFDGQEEAEGFVWSLKNDIQTWYRDAYALDPFYIKVHLALQEPAQREQRLAQASKIPVKRRVTSWEFARNPDVVAVVLSQANGYCQACGAKAPFARKSDGTPYLEVHHRVPLAAGGEDSVENAIALCPNCHREAHYG
ncbi:HNH endonuclease [Marinobacterium sp. A346]|uniref:HNH endonuclease n=2 Tax=Marinobacterium weihaiense TaxID=2851016 RepID=A0ABS6M8V2_9GAMM|nr:HNH endonuclease [Marinobacterium weihaiense]